MTTRNSAVSCATAAKLKVGQGPPYFGPKSRATLWGGLRPTIRNAIYTPDVNLMTCQMADGLRARIWETSTQLAYPQVAQIDGFSTSRQQVKMRSRVPSSICGIGRFQVLARRAR